MTPEEKYELFEKFCSNELSINEKARLDKLISEDKTIEKELQLYKELHIHLDASFNLEKEQETLKANLKRIGDDHFAKIPKEKVVKEKTDKKNSGQTTKKPKVIKLPTWSYAVAASIAIIFGVYFFTQSNPTYNDFAAIPELSISERGVDEENVKNAENAFNKQNYAIAEKYLSLLVSKDPENAEYQFYYAISLLEQDKYSGASEVLEKLSQGNSVYRYKAIWFEALNQLKQKKYDQSAKLLKTLPKEAEDYNKAQELLKKLD
ncbi:hypothetical protein U6A24_01970 [Aquimarina gracilis]|uniref:Tetratricopeptide repeat protein n=1 Tax=Aquimarina gracilis TaxID=874422 RepID=A0ABU5ZQ28_9FLAO|nr:hypothetical protein [Aquimarina gracilis]MEB3344204.1 hypothetical protein [Aquimarina gracilis]